MEDCGALKMIQNIQMRELFKTRSLSSGWRRLVSLEVY
jgi:hypothetical protein